MNDQIIIIHQSGFPWNKVDRNRTLLWLATFSTSEFLRIFRKGIPRENTPFFQVINEPFVRPFSEWCMRRHPIFRIPWTKCYIYTYYIYHKNQRNNPWIGKYPSQKSLWKKKSVMGNGNVQKKKGGQWNSWNVHGIPQFMWAFGSFSTHWSLGMGDLQPEKWWDSWIMGPYRDPNTDLGWWGVIPYYVGNNGNLDPIAHVELVDGWTTFLKNMPICQSNWIIIPTYRGENSRNMWNHHLYVGLLHSIFTGSPGSSTILLDLGQLKSYCPRSFWGSWSPWPFGTCEMSIFCHCHLRLVGCQKGYIQLPHASDVLLGILKQYLRAPGL